MFFELYIVHKQETTGPVRDVAYGNTESRKPSAFIYTSLGSPESACSPLAIPQGTPGGGDREIGFGLRLP